jgi:hypothetical protein
MSAIALREHAHVSKPLPLPEIRSHDDGRRYVSVLEGKPVRRPIVRPGAEERTAFARSLLPGVPISISRNAP